MQLKSLQVFCDVVRYGSFSQAAAAWRVTQSAASQIVLQLEKWAGGQLLNRSTRPLQLTPLGQTLYEGCKGLVEQYVQLEAQVRSAQAHIAATVQVAAIYSVGLGDMGQFVERFEAQLPNVKVHVEYLHPDRVYDRVMQGTADFGLVSFPRKSRKLTALPWREEEMVLTCPPGDPLAHQRSVRPEQLAGQKFVGFDKDLVIRKEMDRYLRDRGVSVEIALEFDNIENIKKAVEVSAGVALLPEPTVRREVQAGTLVAVPLAGGRLVRPLGIIALRKAKLSANAQKFMDLLRQSGPAPAKAAHLLNGAGAPMPPKPSPRNANGPLRTSKRTG